MPRKYPIPSGWSSLPSTDEFDTPSLNRLTCWLIIINQLFLNRSFSVVSITWPPLQKTWSLCHLLRPHLASNLTWQYTIQGSNGPQNDVTGKLRLPSIPINKMLACQKTWEGIVWTWILELFWFSWLQNKRKAVGNLFPSYREAGLPFLHVVYCAQRFEVYWGKREVRGSAGEPWPMCDLMKKSC